MAAIFLHFHMRERLAGFIYAYLWKLEFINLVSRRIIALTCPVKDASKISCLDCMFGGIASSKFQHNVIRYGHSS